MICYYITGHGFGHAIRAAQILKALPPDLPLILKTTVPERLFREELPGRPFTYLPAEYDCGCLQRDSVTVLPRETLDRYGEIARANEAHLAEEIDFLMWQGLRCVITDIPSFPLKAAREAGIPGLAVANFTWHDIYREYVETAEDTALLEAMAAEYAAASLALITPLATPTVIDVFPQAQHVPLVARNGKNIRARLTEKLGMMATRHMALLYLGGWGLDFNWPALARMSDWVFITYDPPAVSIPNVIALERSTWSYADVAASVDAVVSKAGYGIVTECIANQVPLVYVPRTGFSEYSALVAGMASWGGGMEIAEQDFRAGRWQAALAAPLNSNAYATNGAAVIAEKIVRFVNGTA